MNKVIYLLLALSLIANGYLLLQPKTEIVQSSEPEKVVVTETQVQTIEVEDGNLKAQYAKALNEIDSLKNQIKILQDNKEASDKELSKLQEKVALKDISSQISEEIGMEYDVEKEMAIKKNRYELFDNETVDSAWAYRTQDEINQILHENGDTTLYKIDKTECKSSLCKVSLKPYSQSKGAGMAAGMNAMFSFMDGLAEGKKSKYQTSMHTNSDDENVELLIWEMSEE